MKPEFLPVLLLLVCAAAVGLCRVRSRGRTVEPVVRSLAPVQVRALDLTLGDRLADGSRVASVGVGERGDLDGTGVDRSAGRHCRRCNRHGTHHTDTHDEFMAVVVRLILADGTMQTRYLAGASMVEVDPAAPVSV